MRKLKSIAPKTNPSYAFVVDGDTEVWYLNMLKRNERHINVKIKPEIPQKKSVTEQYNLVRELSGKEFTRVFWVVDLDTVIKEDREAPKDKKSPMKQFSEYRNILTEELENVEVIVINPCLEFWLLLHFEQTAKLFSNCGAAEAKLKKHLKGYEKTQRFFTKENADIYLKLKPQLKDAIRNATALGEFDEKNPNKAVCEMQLLFQSAELKKYFE